jgi:hypothetical protein
MIARPAVPTFRSIAWDNVEKDCRTDIARVMKANQARELAQNPDNPPNHNALLLTYEEHLKKTGQALKYYLIRRTIETRDDMGRLIVELPEMHVLDVWLVPHPVHEEPILRQVSGLDSCIPAATQRRTLTEPDGGVSSRAPLGTPFSLISQPFRIFARKVITHPESTLRPELRVDRWPRTEEEYRLYPSSKLDCLVTIVRKHLANTLQPMGRMEYAEDDYPGYPTRMVWDDPPSDEGVAFFRKMVVYTYFTDNMPLICRVRTFPPIPPLSDHITGSQSDGYRTLRHTRPHQSQQAL